MDSKELAKLVRQPEGQLLEFKREWPDLSSAKEKAKVARMIGAMANGLTEGQRGHIIVGREDPDRGGMVVGVEEPPTSEQITEILGKHLGPVPDVEILPSVRLEEGKDVSVLEVRWSQYHPHYSVRDVDGVLSTDRVLVRQGKTTRHLKPPELEMMFRAKDARLGAPKPDGPLIVGFVALPSHADNSASVRIHNVSEEPVTNISAVVDVERAYPAGPVFRFRYLSDMTLDPDQTREFTFQPRQAHFYWPDGSPLDDHKSMWSHWFNITLHLTYRDRHGIIQTILRTVAVP